MLAIISSRYQYGPFLFFVAEVMSNYLTTDGLKNFFLLPEAPLWPEARGICHICHMVNPALLQCFEAVGWAAGRASGLQKTEWWGAGLVICLERDADLHMPLLMPLPLTVSCFSKIQIGFYLSGTDAPG